MLRIRQQFSVHIHQPLPPVPFRVLEQSMPSFDAVCLLDVHAFRNIAQQYRKASLMPLMLALNDERR